MTKAQKHLGIRLDGALHAKFRYVAQYEGRSMSRQILSLMAACVREFEREHGPITEQDLNHERG